MAEYAVYIMANRSGTLYVGVTNDLVRRVDQHRRGENPGFTQRYHITRLVHVEYYGDVFEAIAREKQIKGWVRRRKELLIRQSNPERRDLLGGHHLVPRTSPGVILSPPSQDGREQRQASGKSLALRTRRI